ncbi:MAG: hypothetical protein ACXAD7_06055 [Candidatus Kariarchaeaceae archaeon]|jgi:hypothetical protein
MSSSREQLICQYLKTEIYDSIEEKLDVYEMIKEYLVELLIKGEAARSPKCAFGSDWCCNHFPKLAVKLGIIDGEMEDGVLINHNVSQYNKMMKDLVNLILPDWQ